MTIHNNWEQLIEDFEPRLKRAFLESVQNLRDAAHVDQIVKMLEQGNVNGALRAVGIDPVSFRPLDRSISQAFEMGGEVTAAAIPPAVSLDGFRTVFQFSVRNLAAETWLGQHSGTLIKQITDDQLDAVRNFLTAGLEAGANPRTTALDLVGRIAASGQRQGGIIGLASTQEEWSRAYRAELESDSPAGALTRTLRDKRFDSAVLRADASGEPIKADLVDKMVKSYTNRALRYRAEAIARLETTTALHTAQEQAIQQAVDRGVMAASTVTGIWRTAKPRDKRARESHTPMDGQVRQIGKPFLTGNGVQLLYPGDPDGPIDETAHCRCWREMRVDYLSVIR